MDKDVQKFLDILQEREKKIQNQKKDEFDIPAKKEPNSENTYKKIDKKVMKPTKGSAAKQTLPNKTWKDKFWLWLIILKFCVILCFTLWPVNGSKEIHHQNLTAPINHITYETDETVSITSETMVLKNINQDLSDLLKKVETKAPEMNQQPISRKFMIIVVCIVIFIVIIVSPILTTKLR